MVLADLCPHLRRILRCGQAVTRKSLAVDASVANAGLANTGLPDASGSNLALPVSIEKQLTGITSEYHELSCLVKEYSSENSQDVKSLYREEISFARDSIERLHDRFIDGELLPHWRRAAVKYQKEENEKIYDHIKKANEKQTELKGNNCGNEEPEIPLSEVFDCDILETLDPFKGVVLEVKGAAGGNEGELFAAELIEMYERYAQVESASFEYSYDIANEDVFTGGCGKEWNFRRTPNSFKATIYGENAWRVLRWEAGTHRVVRQKSAPNVHMSTKNLTKTPKNQSNSAAMITAAATVTAVPILMDIDVQINEQRDLDINFWSSGGPGGMSANVTNACCTIVHKPTNITASIDSGDCPILNKKFALEQLRAKIYSAIRTYMSNKRAGIKKRQLFTEDVVSRIRTYHFGKNFCIDHRFEHGQLRPEDVLCDQGIGDLFNAALDALREREINAALRWTEYAIGLPMLDNNCEAHSSDTQSDSGENAIILPAEDEKMICSIDTLLQDIEENGLQIKA